MRTYKTYSHYRRRDMRAKLLHVQTYTQQIRIHNIQERMCTSTSTHTFTHSYIYGSTHIHVHIQHVQIHIAAGTRQMDMQVYVFKPTPSDFKRAQPYMHSKHRSNLSTQDMHSGALIQQLYLYTKTHSHTHTHTHARACRQILLLTIRCLDNDVLEIPYRI